MIKILCLFCSCLLFCFSFVASSSTDASVLFSSSSKNNDPFTKNKQNNSLKKILTHYSQWQGVRYQLGGESRKGIDCSAYMQQIFRDQFSVRLPRSTKEQMKLGNAITKSDLDTGDLVFFKISQQEHHVGIYIGEGKFIHASSSTGVTVSRLDNQYWSQHYQLARRVNEESHA